MVESLPVICKALDLLSRPHQEEAVMDPDKFAWARVAPESLSVHSESVPPLRSQFQFLQL